MTIAAAARRPQPRRSHANAARLPGRALVLAGILLSAFNLRTAVTSITPLLDVLGAQFGFGATVAGLLVAVPCHVMYMMLMVRIERIVLDMEACASEIVAYFTKQDRSML